VKCELGFRKTKVVWKFLILKINLIDTMGFRKTKVVWKLNWEQLEEKLFNVLGKLR